MTKVGLPALDVTTEDRLEAKLQEALKILDLYRDEIDHAGCLSYPCDICKRFNALAVR